MTDAQIKQMVDRFLSWKLPENFSPDGGVSFERFGNKGTPHQYDRQPSGTNLLDYTQAEAMVRHMVDGLPGPKVAAPASAAEPVKAERQFCDFPKCGCSSGAMERCEHPPVTTDT